MTVTVAQLVAPAELTGSAVAYYTAPAATDARIDRAIFSNPTGSSVTITVYIVPPSGSPGTGNQVINAQAVAAGAVYVSPELAGQVLPAGAALYAEASAGASIVMAVSGITVA